MDWDLDFAAEVQLLERKARDLRDCWLMSAWNESKIKHLFYPEGQNLFTPAPPWGKYRVILLATPELSADSLV